MIKFQNYLHYKLPITTNPSDYGKVITKIDNIYFIQLNTSNILILKEVENENFIKLFRKGELIFEFKDFRIDESTFTRIILNQKYTFKNGRLISTEILSTAGNIKIYPIYEDASVIVTPFKNKTNKFTPLSIQKRSYSTNSYRNA
jgi:hypothetical protein